MNTGLAEFSEESSEEPYSRALLENNTYFPVGCGCVASRELPLQCDLQLLVGPVSQSARTELCGTALPAPSASFSLYYLCALQALAAYLGACTPSTTPIDGIRPISTPTGTLESSSSGRSNCSIDGHALCQGTVASSNLWKLFHLPLTTHCASPENALCPTKSTTSLLSTKALDRFVEASKSTTNERTVASGKLDYHRPTNVATFIELPTLRPLTTCCY